MEQSHQNPTQNRKSMPKRDRKDWDLTQMAIKSTGSRFGAKKEISVDAQKEVRPLNEIVKDTEHSPYAS